MRASPQITLFLTRIGFGVFILVWGLSKLVDPGATAAIFATFYGWDGLSMAPAFILGVLQAGLGLAIMAGVFKTVSYGAGILVHGVSTLATAPHLVMPLAQGSNLLFFASVPILLAAIGLFLARDHDVVLSADSRLVRTRSA